jgi:hypothetical protein
MPVSPDQLHALMAQCLAAWRLDGGVCSAGDGAVLVSCGTREIRIEPARPGTPFRWMVNVDGRARGAVSLVAVLRQVRAALDPGYTALRARVAAVPLVPA